MKPVILSGTFIIQNHQVLLLFRKQHEHYETPGGTVEETDAKNPEQPSIYELRNVAVRERKEEVGEDLKVNRMEYLGRKEFTIPDGRIAIAHKWIAHVTSGTPRVAEPELFDHYLWLRAEDFDTVKVSPDFKLFVQELKRYL